MWFISIVFLVWRILDLIIAYFANHYDKYNEHFLYKIQLYHYNPNIPKFLIAFANYDGAHYLHIAYYGYSNYEQAFFPLFPLLVHLLAPIFHNLFYGTYFLSGLIIANISFLLGLYFFKKYLVTIGKSKETIVWILVFLLISPMSFFFGAVYTEGLFFFLVSIVLYLSQKKRYITLVIFSILAALTRLMGSFLIIPLFTTILIEQQKLRIPTDSLRRKGNYLLKFLVKHIKLVFISLAPLLGLSSYMFYLYFSSHNPFAFYDTLTGFHTGRTIHRFVFLPQVYYRYLHIFIVAQHNSTYFVAWIEFVIFNLFLIILLYDLWRLLKKESNNKQISLVGLNLFSLTNLLLPTFTGTMTSLPRYALLSLSFFIRIGEMKNIVIRIAFLILFAILHILLLTLFIQGYFVS